MITHQFILEINTRRENQQNADYVLVESVATTNLGQRSVVDLSCASRVFLRVLRFLSTRTGHSRLLWREHRNNGEQRLYNVINVNGDRTPHLLYHCVSSKAFYKLRR